MSSDGFSSNAKPLQRLFLKGGRLHPLCRLVLYLLVLAAAYFGMRPVLRLVVVTLFGSRTMVPEMITLVGVIPLGTWFTRRFIDKRDMASLGFALHRGWLVDFGIGLLLGAVLMGAIFLVEVILGWIEVNGFAWTAQSFATFASGLFTAAASMLAVAVVEETFSRGYML
jgi:hypothetical protein